MVGKLGRRTWLVVLGGALSALLVAVGVVLVNGDTGDEELTGGGPSAPPEGDAVLEALWRTTPVDVGEADLGEDFQRVWASDRVVVLLTNAGVWGHDPESGEDLWRLEHPEGGHLVPCATSEDMNDQGVGAVLFRPEGRTSCTVLAAVDTGRGEVMWSEELPSTDNDPDEDVPATVGERAITVDLEGWGLPTPRRFAVADGEELPELPGGEDCVRASTPFWDISGERAIVRGGCQVAGEVEGRLTVYDTETGDELWTRSVEDRRSVTDGSVVTGEPLILMTPDSFQVYDDDGDVRSEIPRESRADLEAGSDEYDAAYETSEYHLADSLLITRSRNSDEEPDIIRGFDVETGEELWEREFPEGRGLVGAVDEEPLVLHEVLADEGYPYLNIARLDPADGTLNLQGLLPQDAEDSFLYLTDVMEWDEQSLYAMELNGAARTFRLVAIRR
ncbi:PQQ-binding-like beta-propeller repeat protein [Streptomyces sp. B6B3]|uniref:outer membrane protein assembly factor BamB family protein n=1 Tax=Streptomyces sp. B6B3 TaxID=3153570 RepID=UPI00325C892F